MAKAKKSPLAADLSWPDSAFWTFSVDLYRRPGVEAACLALQDRHDLNVNLMLWALWLADCGVALDQPTLARAEDAVASWQAEVVAPLRTVRRELRLRSETAGPDDIAEQWPSQVEAMRQAVLGLELHGEHLAQLALSRLGDELKPTHRAGAALAGGNLACLGVFEEGDRGDLANLIKQAFPDTHLALVDTALDSVFAKA